MNRIRELLHISVEYVTVEITAKFIYRYYVKFTLEIAIVTRKSRFIEILGTVCRQMMPDINHNLINQPEKKPAHVCRSRL